MKATSATTIKTIGRGPTSIVPTAMIRTITAMIAALSCGSFTFHSRRKFFEDQNVDHPIGQGEIKYETNNFCAHRRPAVSDG